MLCPAAIVHFDEKMRDLYMRGEHTQSCRDRRQQNGSVILMTCYKDGGAQYTTLASMIPKE